MGVYASTMVILTLAAGWCTIVVGSTLVAAIDAVILDGSGRAAPPEAAPAPSTARLDFTPTTAVNRQTSLVSDVRATDPITTASLPKVSTDEPTEDPAVNFHNGRGDTFRTYCVRLCDGYFFPISFSTTPDRFQRDAEACNDACGAPARLFVHRNPGGGPGTMVTLEGLPYTALKTAFLFRARYDAQCRCQPQPWDEASQDRHRLFAATDAARKGNKTAAATARQLKAKVDGQRRRLASARDAAEVTARREIAALAARTALKPPSSGPSRFAMKRGKGRPGVPAVAVAGAAGAAGLLTLTASTGPKVAAAAPEPTRSRTGYRVMSGEGRNWTDRAFNGQ